MFRCNLYHFVAYFISEINRLEEIFSENSALVHQFSAIQSHARGRVLSFGSSKTGVFIVWSKSKQRRWSVPQNYIQIKFEFQSWYSIASDKERLDGCSKPWVTSKYKQIPMPVGNEIRTRTLKILTYSFSSLVVQPLENHKRNIVCMLE